MIRNAILYTIQCVTAILIGLEVSIPPNPYGIHIIILLSILIAIRYNLPDKIISLIEKLILRCLNHYWK